MLARSNSSARRQLHRSPWRSLLGVEFSTGSALAPSNDNSPKLDPDPNQRALVVPANDNGAESSLTAAIVLWGVVLAAGTVLVATNLRYLPSVQPRLPTVPNCAPAATAALVVRITPDTSISALTNVQFDDMIKAMKRQEGLAEPPLHFAPTTREISTSALGHASTERKGTLTASLSSRLFPSA